MFVWDEKKRLSNFEKHGLDFADASEIYNHPHKFTTKSQRHGEERNADIALVELRDAFVTLIYVKRDENVRVISFRASSRDERRLYAEFRQPK